MPFKSQAQRGFLFANHPGIARRFADETPKDKKLPYKVGKDGSGPISRMFRKGK